MTLEEPRTPPAGRRLAGAPISWGVCEVPGWGRQLPAERVLAEMAQLGLPATELGPLGYLPLEPAALRDTLAIHGLALVGGFVPLVLHEPSLGTAHRQVEEVATTFAAAGADVFVAALVMDAGWSPPAPLDDARFSTLVEHLGAIAELVAAQGLTFALHPHAGTLVETAADVERMLGATDVGWCLDTGHLLIGGGDPVAFVREHGDRVVHVHLKDVDAGVAARYRAGELTLMGATRAGLFRPLGQGDASISSVLAALDAHGYERWLVLEQDAALTGEEPPAGSGPVLDVQASIEFLTDTAPRRERVAR
jgi:inosose dehydratase